MSGVAHTDPGSRRDVLPRALGGDDAAPCARFPTSFLWGAATAGHQVEGENRASDWFEYEEEGRLPHRSGSACRQHELYAADFDLARLGGHNAHRLSIEWSRIEPTPGGWSAEGLEHYRRVVSALRERGLEPIVTLHHFTNPAWFTRRGGWRRGDSPTRFARYVKRVVDALGDHVRYWVTINEPMVFAKHGYIVGDWPPCVSGSWIQAARVLLNLARGHEAAYRVIHEKAPDAQVGFAHSAPIFEPCDPDRRVDRIATRLRDGAWNDAFFHLLAVAQRMSGRKQGADRGLDFIGINYYTRSIVRGRRPRRTSRPEGHRRSRLSTLFGEECTEDHHARGPWSDLGWEIYPRGLERTLIRFAGLGRPLLVTENGLATRDEALRTAFVTEHLHALCRTVERGIPVLGYLYWSLIDNYEWAHGREPRFGLVEVDYSTQRRIPRPAYHAYAAWCRACGARPDEVLVDVRTGAHERTRGP